MNLTELLNYQDATGLNFVMGGNLMDQARALGRFKDMVVAEFIEDSVTNTDFVAIPDGLPKPNQTVAVLTTLDSLDVCKFVTTSDGGYYYDNTVDTVWQPEEVVSWKAVDALP